MVIFYCDNGDSVGVDVGPVDIGLKIQYPSNHLLLMVMLNDVNVVVQPLGMGHVFC